MKLWKVVCNEFEYDQYDAFVVRAENPEEAIKLCDFGEYQKKHPISCDEILSDGPRERILGSFNPG